MKVPILLCLSEGIHTAVFVRGYPYCCVCLSEVTYTAVFVCLRVPILRCVSEFTHTNVFFFRVIILLCLSV